ncbi:hypothetical protein V6N11_081523 [Hibiscus sabdariffa]|uniref:Protein kinase domain-containing protein n=1 Tax=Hibiscus sabdariffa TaxID=183260 RepID=A0ABR2AB22_9ROSI
MKSIHGHVPFYTSLIRLTQSKSCSEQIHNGIIVWVLLNPHVGPNSTGSTAAAYQQGICGEEVCGKVAIPSPFGIHRNCYTLPWFRVTCEENKPFINIKGINLELLGSYSPESINVNYPVTYVDCNREPGITGADVDLDGTPFYLSGDYNYFGTVGCGNLATIYTNGTDSMGGCVQPICGGEAGGTVPGCYTRIFGNLTSYTVRMANMYGGKTSCASVFMLCISYFEDGYPLPVEINGETTYVPAALLWDSSYCGETGCEVSRPTDLIDEKSCGSLSFEYPFGVRSRSYSKSRFEVVCNKTSEWERTPFLNINGVDLQILDFWFLDGTIVVNHSITYFNCRGNNNNGMSLNLKGTSFYYSDITNMFWSSGCGNLVTIFDDRKRKLIGGCSQPSCRIVNETSSTTGCGFTIPRGLNSFFANMSDEVGSGDYSKKKSCGFASPVYSRVYRDLTSSTKDFDLNNWTYVPVSLQWGTPIRASCQLSQGTNISCSSNGVYCWRNLNSTHLCVCTEEKHISQGTYCEGCITSIVSVSLLIAIWQMRKAWKKRQDIKLKQKYFKRNGGLLLQKHLSSNEGNIEKIKLFTSKEMEKATDYYNKNRILGQGGQGTVYKGMLTDGSIINHRNVVKLLGCCLEAEVPLLVYEFIQNGTLYDLIHYQTEEFPLTWEMRLRIAIEIANALFYLHSSASVSIYHRDIKSSNILLDEKYRAKEESLLDILDSTIVNDSSEKEIIAMAKLARRCLNLNGKRRPTMKQVAMELELIKTSKANVDIEEGGDEESETDDIIESWNANLSWSTSISITTEQLCH